MNQSQKHQSQKRRSFLCECGLVALLIAIVYSNSGPQAESQTEPEIAAAQPSDVAQLDHEPVDPLVPPAMIPKRFLLQDQDTLSLPNIFAVNFEHDSQATFHPHGEEICASGCAASSHPTPKLEQEMFTSLMEEFAGDPMSKKSKALEALLYYGNQTLNHIDQHGTEPLSSQHESFLLHELKKTHATVAIRIVDEFGIIRASNEAADVPFNRRHVFDLEGNNLQPLVASGTVKRVGLDHIWTRL